MKDQISKWFDEGISLKMEHMIIAKDVAENETYVVYTKIVERSVATLVESRSQKVLEVYNLKQDKEEQLNEDCNWRF